MESQIDTYRKMYLVRARRGAWLKCLIWGGVKVVLEGVAFFLKATNIWMRISLGLIWLGIALAAFSLLYITLRMDKLLPSPSGLRIYFILQIIGLVLLTAQLPLLGFGLFFPDGIVTIVSVTLFTFAGFGVNQVFRKADMPSEDLFP